jgi:hypothetical protein
MDVIPIMTCGNSGGPGTGDDMPDVTGQRPGSRDVTAFWLARAAG